MEERGCAKYVGTGRDENMFCGCVREGTKKKTKKTQERVREILTGDGTGRGG